MLPKSVQNTSKTEPKRRPKRSRRPSPKQKPKTHLKILRKAPQNEPKKEPKITKNGLRGLFSHRQINDLLEAVFSCFLSPPGSPRPSKSSQNAVRVCKNRGPPFSPEATLFYKKVPKMTPFGTPRGSQKLRKRQKRAIGNGAKNKTKKTLKCKPVLAREREAR